jgi:hypothetical protein
VSKPGHCEPGGDAICCACHAVPAVTRLTPLMEQHAQ